MSGVYPVGEIIEPSSQTVIEEARNKLKLILGMPFD